MRIKIVTLTMLFFIFISCSGKDRQKQYINIYKDMQEQLLIHVRLLKQIEQKGKVTPELEKKVLSTQKKIISIKNRVDSYGAEYDNDTEIRKKLRKTLISISITNYYIKRVQEKIKNMPGVKRLFSKLRKRGTD